MAISCTRNLILTKWIHIDKKINKKQRLTTEFLGVPSGLAYINHPISRNAWPSYKKLIHTNAQNVFSLTYHRADAHGSKPGKADDFNYRRFDHRKDDVEKWIIEVVNHQLAKSSRQNTNMEGYDIDLTEFEQKI